MKNLFNKIKYFLFLAVGISLMYYAFKGVDWNQMAKDMKETKFFWVFLSMAMGIMAFVFRGIRWVILIEALGYNASRLNCIYSVTVGYFANLIVPRMGEVTRCTALNQVEKIPLEKLLGTILMERVLDLIILISLILTTILLKYEEFYPLISDLINNKVNNPSDETGSSGLIMFFAIVSLITIPLIIFRKKIIQLNIYKKILGILKGFGEGLISVFYLKKKISFLLHTFGIWVMYYLMTFVVVFAIKDTQNLNPADGLFVMVMGGLGMLAPVQGGIGTYHLMVKIALSKLGIVEELNPNGTILRDPGLLFATILHTAQTVMTITTGGFALLMLYLEKRKKRAKQTQPNKIQNIIS